MFRNTSSKNVVGKFGDEPITSSSSKQLSHLSDTTSSHENISTKSSRSDGHHHHHHNQLPQIHGTDPKALAMYLQYQAATAAMLGIPPPPGAPFLWPGPIMDHHVGHHPSQAPFMVPYHQLQQHGSDQANMQVPGKSIPHRHGHNSSQNNQISAKQYFDSVSEKSTTPIESVPPALALGGSDNSNDGVSKPSPESLAQKMLKSEQTESNDSISPSAPIHSTSVTLSPATSSTNKSVPSVVSAANHAWQASHHAIGMSLPNLPISNPHPLVQLSQHQGLPPQTSGNQSRRGSVASESGCVSYFH